MSRAGTNKQELAAAAWAPLVRFFLGMAPHRSRVLARFGLTAGDAKALLTLDGRDGVPMRHLAHVWECDASNATWMVDRLEQRGLAERKASATDRRVKLVALTEEGEAMKAQVAEAFLEPPEALLTLTRADLQALRDAVGRLPVAETGAVAGGAPHGPGCSCTRRT